MPEQQLASLLDRHPYLLSQVGVPSSVRDSTVTRVVRDTVATVWYRNLPYRIAVPLWQVTTHYRLQQNTLVLDNARSRRLLAEAEGKIKILAAQLKASEQEQARLRGLAYPHWYSTTWFWIALLLAFLLVGSVVLRFARFSVLPF